MIEAYNESQLAELEGQIDEWLDLLNRNYDHIIAIDRSADGGVRWYVRMGGEEKDFITVWLTLGQRTLRYETYVMGAPEDNQKQFFQNLLRRNDRLVGAHFSVGAEDAVYLRGEMPVGQLSFDDLDRVLGTLYAEVEQCFQTLLRLGFASHF